MEEDGLSDDFDPQSDLKGCKSSFSALPAEIRQQILRLNCPLSIFLANIENGSTAGEDESGKENFYKLNSTLALGKDLQAKSDFETQIRLASNSTALREDMLCVIEQRDRELNQLDAKVKSQLDRDNEWTGALYRIWLRDERVLHEYVYYSFRTRLPLVPELRNASYELIKLKRMAGRQDISSPAANFYIPFMPNGRSAQTKIDVIVSRKRKWRPEESKVDVPQLGTWTVLHYFPKSTVHFQRRYGKDSSLPSGPIDEIENGHMYFAQDEDRL